VTTSLYKLVKQGLHKALQPVYFSKACKRYRLFNQDGRGEVVA